MSPEAIKETQLKINTGRMLQVIDQYQQEIEAPVLTPRLQLKGKMLKEAIAEHPGWVVYYDQRRAELKQYVNQVEGELERISGIFYSRYNEQHSRDLGDRAIGQYIKREPDYNKALNLLNEVKGLYDQYTAVCGAFESRGFQLRDLTNARIADVHADTI